LTRKATYISYPEITRAAIKQKCYTNGLRYWECLARARNFTFPMSTTIVREDLMDTFLLKRRASYKILARGNGLFWDYTRGTYNGNPGSVRIYSPEEVAQRLGLKSTGPTVERELFELLDNSPRKYQYVNLMGYMNEDALASPVTQSKIAELTGISPKCQQIYKKALDIDERANYLLVEARADYEECCAYMQANGLSIGLYKIARKRIYSLEKKQVLDVWGIFRRIGNTFPGTVYQDSLRSNVKCLGLANGDGVWAENEVCTRLLRYLDSTLTITGGRLWAPTLPVNEYIQETFPYLEADPVAGQTPIPEANARRNELGTLLAPTASSVSRRNWTPRRWYW